MFRGSTEERTIFRRAIQLFEQKTGYRVFMIDTAVDQYATKLQTAILGNAAPDVFYFDPPQTKAYITNKVLLEMDPYLESTREPVTEIWESGMNRYRFDGEMIGQGPLYAMPKDVGPFSYGYNKTLLAKYGVNPPDPDKPMSWEEYLKRCRELTGSSEKNGKRDHWGASINIGADIHAFLWSNGANWLSEDARRVTVNTPEFREALQFIIDLQHKYKVTPSIYESQGLDGYQRWLRGQIGFFPIAPWDLTLYRTLDFDFDLCPYPVGKTGKPATWIGSLGIGVSAKTKKPEQAAELAIFLSCDPDAQKVIVEGGQTIPNTRSYAQRWAADTSTKPRNKQEYLDIVENYGRITDENRTYTRAWMDTFFQNIQPTLEGREDVASFLSRIQPRMQADLDRGEAQFEIDKKANA